MELKPLLGSWIMEWEVVIWSVVYSSGPHSQVAVGATPHLYVVKRNKLTPVRRRLSLTQNGPDRYIPNDLGLILEIKVRGREV